MLLPSLGPRPPSPGGIARSIKINTARVYLEREGVQVSTEAAAALALGLDAQARSVAERALEELRKDNELRAVHRLDPVRRITAEHIRRAML